MKYFAKFRNHFCVEIEKLNTHKPGLADILMSVPPLFKIKPYCILIICGVIIEIDS